MPRHATPLTVKSLETLPPGLHADGDGLYLHVGPGGRSWIYRFTLGGKRRDMGLGPLEPGNGLHEARDRLYQLRAKVRAGTDPIDSRLAERGIVAKSRIARTTFRQAAEAYILAHEASWKNAQHRYQWRQSLESYVYPAIGDMAVASIDTDAVLSVLRPIWLIKTETASRVRGRIEIVLGAAKAAGMRDGENPALWSTLKHMLPEKKKIARVEHHAAAAIDDMADLYAKIATVDTIVSRALRFVILTASRSGEVLGARWDEFDLEAGLWVVPGARMKASKDHRVALPAAALAIVKELAAVRVGDFVFQGKRTGQPLSEMSMRMLLRRIGHGDLTVHGFRSTFRDWCSERTDSPSEVAQMALAHAVGDKVEAAYRRGDLLEKRREQLALWAAHCGA